MADEGWRGSPTPAIDPRRSAKGRLTHLPSRAMPRRWPHLVAALFPRVSRSHQITNRPPLVGFILSAGKGAELSGVVAPDASRAKKDLAILSAHVYRNRGSAPRDWSGS